MADAVPLDPGEYSGTYKAIGGFLSLDFANLVSFRAGDRPHDWLAPAENLSHWAELFVGDPFERGWQPSAQTVDQAIELRERLATIFTEVAASIAPNAQDLTEVAAAARRAWSHQELISVGPRVSWIFLPDHPLDCRLLDLLALDAVRLLTTDDLTRLRVCPGCGWVFVDKSPTRRRRWCDPADCGNRARQRRHYRRTRHDDTDPRACEE
ncbi:CGNR zinc finger domain-containing protein [Brevibacterium oceani]|uniref:CGNR zinc finger domain-containing protein n=1 Tax=Brevibacterium oceani TaxID=358099 RepID=UPI001B336685|nr:ABATE domain-containing protein [Brevibacterium oceani]